MHTMFNRQQTLSAKQHVILYVSVCVHCTDIGAAKQSMCVVVVCVVRVVKNKL